MMLITLDIMHAQERTAKLLPLKDVDTPHAKSDLDLKFIFARWAVTPDNRNASTLSAFWDGHSTASHDGQVTSLHINVDAVLEMGDIGKLEPRNATLRSRTSPYVQCVPYTYPSH